MDLDSLLFRYFGTTDPEALHPEVLIAGIERCQVELGLEHDGPKRFALWALLHMLGAAPELDAVFEKEEDREAARNFMDLLAASQDESQT
ncbi:hypothetical protein [Altererythrobacter sp.]|uniref:hypothetical protein n=1 Tax=Altererythrobacter sp. TaxID=1872480 RepID=UPI003D0845C9